MKQHNWTDIPEERLNPKLTRRVLHTGSMTIAKIGLAKGATVPLHQHVSEQVTTLESGRLRIQVGEEESTLVSGDVLEIPPNAPHQVEALEDSVAIDVFHPLREDWIRGDDAYLRG